VLGISIDKGGEFVVEVFVEKNELTFPMFLDPNQKAVQRYKISATPTVLLIDREGKIVGKAIGPRPWTEERGRHLVEHLLTVPSQ